MPPRKPTRNAARKPGKNAVRKKGTRALPKFAVQQKIGNVLIGVSRTGTLYGIYEVSGVGTKIERVKGFNREDLKLGVSTLGGFTYGVSPEGFLFSKIGENLFAPMTRKEFENIKGNLNAPSINLRLLLP
ncbi:MAG: hypothetical protein J4224_01745 [Candidatus Diapherotrites archaeon]|uniref:Uncharacterized protein n=1 Tax=Candidatus Iainarchaeum sp. TaxID=3101447 RepID=A0A7J4IV35_9ARCH|nr:MAG: hypothetical protein QT03_C0001G1298 [archaeon GW2011_AR10]MBS3059128.1 hypothetical protein [Candidatus Diapherotrites archaeon]HIH08085.1 hypothetical protein [Candidatus Diapherotrites archaeon]